MKPLVSVLMSVHDEPENMIETAVKSICNQSYDNIEFIIIDDASNEGIYEYLKSLANQYPKIRLYRNEINLGLTATLNKGLSLVEGEYIARMDADDYSLPQRIQMQVEYLQRYKDVDILGTGVVSFGDRICFMSQYNGASNEQIQSDLFFTSSLCHPSVMIRKSFLRRTNLTYDEHIKKGQDYDLWERASVFGMLAVLPNVLLYYRLHPNQITSTNRKDQDTTTINVMKRRIQRLGLKPTERELVCHRVLRSQEQIVSLRELSDWIDKLTNASETYSYIDSKILRKNLIMRFVLLKLKWHKLLSVSQIPVFFKIIGSRISLNKALKREAIHVRQFTSK